MHLFILFILERLSYPPNPYLRGTTVRLDTCKCFQYIGFHLPKLTSELQSLRPLKYCISANRGPRASITFRYSVSPRPLNGTDVNTRLAFFFLFFDLSERVKLSKANNGIYYINTGTVCVCVCLSVPVRSRERNVVWPGFFRRRKELHLASCTNCFSSLYYAWFERKSVWNISTGYALKSVPACYIFRLPWAGRILPTA